ncbi:MAG TPA: ATP-binding protein [Nannocystaceae bacterium]|nr:ATP-binding protein [Nannocystaceae bacterium]
MQGTGSPSAIVVASDLAIALSACAIAGAIVLVVHRRRDAAGLGWLLPFTAFLLAIGGEHVVDVWRAWRSTAIVDSISAVAALVAVATAAWLAMRLPLALRTPTSDERHEEQLQAQRRRHEQMQRVNAELEARMAERTRELERSNRELERSNRELEQFAYVASHDLREPLRMVTSYTNLLARRYHGRLDASADEFIGYALEGCERMRQLIHDVLEYSRVDRQHKPEPVALEQALAAACDDLAVSIETSDACITHDALPTIECTRSQLVQLLENLLSNAIKYRGEEPPRIHVAATRRDDEVVLSVRDNGIGIDMRHAERVFGMFQRLHTRGTYPGTGMGLAMCKKIVEVHRGRIWVESRPNEGATFYCAFPVASTGASARSDGGGRH